MSSVHHFPQGEGKLGCWLHPSNWGSPAPSEGTAGTRPPGATHHTAHVSFSWEKGKAFCGSVKVTGEPFLRESCGAILSKAGVNRGEESNTSERKVTVLSRGFQDISRASEENTHLPPLGIGQFTSFTLKVLLHSRGWRTCNRGPPRPGNRGTPPETPQLESSILASPSSLQPSA